MPRHGNETWKMATVEIEMENGNEHGDGFRNGDGHGNARANGKWLK
jgi:hypothetical protein